MIVQGIVDQDQNKDKSVRGKVDTQEINSCAEILGKEKYKYMLIYIKQQSTSGMDFLPISHQHKTKEDFDLSSLSV